MADDPFMKELGYPGGGGGKAGDATPASTPANDDDTPNAADVGRGLAKSGAGTVVAIPRLANAAIGLIPRYGSGMRKTLGDLAEQIPGVQSLETFADSPNKNWAESAGYWGGEGLQLFGGGLVGEAAKGAEAAGALSKGARVADDVSKDVEGVADFGKMREAKRLALPNYDTPLAPNPTAETSFAKAVKDQYATEGAQWRFDRQSERASAALAEQPKPRPAFRVMSAEEQAAEEAKIAAGRAGREDEIRNFYRSGRPSPLRNMARAAAGGGVAGAITDPQDPGTGFVSGAALGGLTPLAGAALRSGTGQFMASHGARSAAAGGAMALGKAAGIPTEWLWFVGIPQLLRFWHSSVGRSIGESAERTAMRTGRAMERSSGRVPGAAAGAAANQFAPAGGLQYEPVPEEQPQ